MSNEILEIIKKHISDTLGVKLISLNTSRDGKAFSVKINNKTITIFIPCPLIDLLEKSGDVNKCLENIDILSFIKNNPECNASISYDGAIIDSINC